MNKLSAIRNMCPETKIYVSPILPCAIPGLNNRAAWFNSLLFSVRNIWWHELKFDQFCCRQTGMLASQFRPFRNRGDKIHLGRHGINALEHALLCALNKVDGRSIPLWYLTTDYTKIRFNYAYVINYQILK